MSTKNSVHSSETTVHQFKNHSRELLFVIGTVLVIALAVVLVNFQGGTDNVLSTTPQMLEAAPEVSYRDALAMSNAPAVAADPSFDYDEALAIAQYTQPWSVPQTGASDPASRYIGDLVAPNTQYIEAMSDVEYRDALAAANNQSAESFSAADYDEVLAVMQFTQPWLNPEAEPVDLASRFIEVQPMTNVQAVETTAIVDYREALDMSDAHTSLASDSTLSYDEVLAILQFTQPWLNPQAEPADLAARYIEAMATSNE